MNNRKRLIIPVEIKARELEAKVFLAAMACLRGYQVYLGRAGDITSMAKYLPPSVFLEKDIAGFRSAQFAVLRSKGHKIVAWDEEGVVEKNTDWYVRARMTSETLDQVDRLFVWGREQYNAVSKHYPDYMGKIVNSGNPRFDLLRAENVPIIEQESQSYVRRFGRYILVNTNFGLSNIFDGRGEHYVQYTSKNLSFDASERQYFEKSVQFERELFGCFQTMIVSLAQRFPDTQIVLRPHPSENHEFWRNLVSRNPNVHVIFEGTAVGWIKGAKLLIHNGCTTGLEGTVMGSTVVAYRPIRSNEYELQLPNDVSVEACNLEELFDCVRCALDDQPPSCSSSAKDRLNAEINALTGPFATTRILDEIDQIFPLDDDPRPWLNPQSYRVKHAVVQAYNGIHDLWRWGRRYGRTSLKPNYYRSGSVEDVRIIINRIRACYSQVSDIDSHQIMRFCYRLEMH